MFTFYAPEADPEMLLAGNGAKPLPFYLSEEESFHCVQVLRLSKNTPIKVINGKGYRMQAIILQPNPKSCEIGLLTQEFISPRPYSLHMAIAPTKNLDRFEWFLEKATEIGIDQITPMLTQNSERRILKEDRLHKIIVSTVKQSNQAYFPKLNKLRPLADLINDQNKGTLMVAHCRDMEKNSLANALLNKEERDFTILIGPEGDFTEVEIKRLLDNKFIPISLGNTRLRTETAGMVVCAQMAIMKA